MFPYSYTPNNYSNIIRAKLKHQKNSSSSLETRESNVDWNKIMYKFMTTEDNAEIVHSELKEDGTVLVYVEKPDIKDCFHHMRCSIPSYSIKEVLGFSEEETQRYMDVIKSNSHLIMESSKE